MSTSRRTRLEIIQSSIEQIAGHLRDLVDAEQERYDSRSECWQESEKGEWMQDALDKLEEAVDALTDASASIDDALEVM